MKILLFHAHEGDPLSFLIKAMSRSPYCHAAVLVEERLSRQVLISNFNLGDKTDQRAVIVEAYYPHVRARFLDASEMAEIDVVEVAGTGPEMEAKSMGWAIEAIQHQIDYGISDLFRFLAPGRVVLGEDNDQSYLKHTICSQFAFNVYRMGGIRLLNCHDFEVRPDMLLWSPFCTNLGKLSDYFSPLSHTTNEEEQGQERAQPSDLPGTLAADPRRIGGPVGTDSFEKEML